MVNVDDPYGRRLARDFPDASPFAIDTDADMRALDVRLDAGRLETSAWTATAALRTPLPGRFNVANVLGRRRGRRARSASTTPTIAQAR